jgi:phage terminase large subunit-like protein
MTAALESFDTAVKEGALSHDGNAVLARHVANAHRHDLPQMGEDGRPLWLIRKERHDSPHKIDLCMAAVLSWEARTDAIAAGANQLVEAGIEVW